MTRKFAAHVVRIQDAIVAAVKEQWTTDHPDLAPPLDHVEPRVAAGLGTWKEPHVVTIRVLVPDGRGSSGSSSHTLAALFFPVVVDVAAFSDADQAVVLRDAVGLVVDAFERDPFLGGVVTGVAEPTWELEPFIVDGGVARQVVVLRVAKELT